MSRPRTADLARGKWRGILMALGVESSHLTGKHAACPLCGGKDRFRFTNQRGDGSYVCSQCGNGSSGFHLLEQLNGWDFATAAKEVDKVIDNVPTEAVRPPLDDAKRRRMLNELWAKGARIVEGDPVHRYLTGRGCDLPQNVGALRYVERCPAPDGIERPAMVAQVVGPDGKGVTLHRTFLLPDGSGKAMMDQPRALMPGEVPPGSAIRLAMHGGTLGIGEGIESSLCAGKRFGIPTWAAISSALLAKWTPPEGVSDVWIFGDNDPAYGGQAASYAIAHKLAVKKGMTVQVTIPARVGLDWADEAAA